MVTDAEIRTAAITMFSQGKKPTIRGVIDQIGGGDWHRVSAILAELNLPKPVSHKVPDVPDYLGNAIQRATGEAYERGKADTMLLVESLQKEKELLLAKIATLSETMTEMQRASRAATPKQMRNIVHDTLSDFLGEVRPRQKPHTPRRHTNRSTDRRVGSFENVLIDGKNGREIYQSRLENLTPAQQEWKREQMRYYHTRKNAKRTSDGQADCIA